MAAIGGITFDSLTLAGDGVSALGEMLEAVTRPGVDGKAYLKTGKRPGPSVYVSRHGYSTVEGRKSGIEACLAKQGTVGTLTKEDGTSWQVVVLGVSLLYEKEASLVVGYSGRFLAHMRWELEVRGS